MLAGGLYGMQIITDPHLQETKRYQFRFPRSKKDRIRKKWKACDRNWRSKTEYKMYQMGNTFFMHPALEAQVRKSLSSVR